MRRRVLPAPVIEAELPVRLKRFCQADWSDVHATAHDRLDAESIAAANAGTTSLEQQLSMMARWRRRRQFDDARTAWCVEHGLTDERGEIDWQRFGPLLHDRNHT